ncbi:MAG: M50 family metallopeptidase [Candidatus Peribacteraceae bacterium]|jgi:regulator of sigma E protease|nr:M50 family metallopeptidase [Candidatus Peribacteraceae bacterium]MDP7454467.1 M50 family metallopeptidase [Candidatus Peribacteraceae bacterium]|tara:strand:- start:4388 stop:5512 length:1125 start_codon:yes stop_codon:yes gene_type:complete
MTVLLSVVAFLLLLTVLILIHEWGHFTAARLSGVTVEEFGLGLPPRARKLWKSKGTVFSLNWIPFGGFVRLKGENAITNKERTSKGSFGSVAIWKRVVILSAGVFMNLLLAIVILTIGFSVGKWIPTYTTLEAMELSAQKGIIDLELGVFVSDVISGDSAAKVGVPKESILSAVDGVPVTVPNDVVSAQEGKRVVTYTIKSGEGFETEKDFTIRLKDGKAGIVLTPFPIKLDAPKHDIFMALGLAFRETWVVSILTVKGIGTLMKSLVQSGKVPEGIAGIVGIAQLTHASVQEGFMMYLRLVALLSLSLAVLNILPFPALDGGRLVFVIAELIGRKPVNRKFELATNTVGFLFLIFLLLFITYYDVVRLFTGES